MERLEARSKITATLLEIVRRRSPSITSVSDEQKLTSDLGLQSLDMAELVAVLEIEFGADPFLSQASIADVHTVGDLCKVYLNMTQPS
jgi:acyl carrier protein